MEVEIWSDMSCVWCYITKRRFEWALSQFDHRDEVSIVWRSFRLVDDAPACRVERGDELAAERYDISREAARKLQDHVTQVAAARDGLDLRFDKYVLSNMTDAHRMAKLARDHGDENEMQELLMRACLSEGETVSDHATLKRLGLAAGIPADEIDSVLASDRYLDEVEQDEQRARDVGVVAVPAFLVDSRGLYGPDHFGIVQDGEGPEGADILEMLNREWNMASV